MYSIIPLYYLCSVAGLVMVVGGIWLIYKEKIFIDRETKQITEIEIPGGLKFKTNMPALVLFVLGLSALCFPIYKLSGIVNKSDVEEIGGAIDPPRKNVKVILAVKECSTDLAGKFMFNVEKTFTSSGEVSVYAITESDHYPKRISPNDDNRNITIPIK
jgi:hypothetical protein